MEQQFETSSDQQRVEFISGTIEQTLDSVYKVVPVANDGSTTLVCYGNNLILTHRWGTLILCEHCGQVKNIMLHFENGLSQAASEAIMELASQAPQCECQKPLVLVHHEAGAKTEHGFHVPSLE